MIEGENKVVNGRDHFLTDKDILRFVNGRDYDLNAIINDLYYHLEWRQTNVPMPLLNDTTLYLLNTGLFYIHGRTMDFSPILVLDFEKLTILMKNK